MWRFRISLTLLQCRRRSFYTHQTHARIADQGAPFISDTREDATLRTGVVSGLVVGWCGTEVTSMPIGSLVTVFHQLGPVCENGVEMAWRFPFSQDAATVPFQ